MKTWIAGEWTESIAQCPVKFPYTGEIIDHVPEVSGEQVNLAVESAQRGAQLMAAMSGYDRAQILNRAADLLQNQMQKLIEGITLEEGKPVSEAQAEVSRVPDLLRLCAFEGTQLRGETLPLDSQPNTKGKLGFTVRVPCGIVVAITPFNYPLLLVAHKVAPALAAGNAVVLKPAEQTPLTAIKFVELLLEAGIPPEAIQCVTGKGAAVGPLLCADPRVRAITFTGSTETGLAITRLAGVKKLSLELGSNCPLLVLQDADLDTVAQATAISGFVNAGQVCISTQRVLVHERVYVEFLELLRARAEAIAVGDPRDRTTKLSALISPEAAHRVQTTIAEALGAGAKLVAGAERQGAILTATVLADVKPEMRIFREELFGPAIGVLAVDSVDKAIELANDTAYGLGAGVFTRDVATAVRCARELNCGNVMINWTPLWRADCMPYGGLRSSGIGREGPRYAVEELTETKTVVFH